MRLSSFFSLLLLCSVTGCYSCPNYYGPGLGPRPYGACVDTRTLAPPVPMGNYQGRQRHTLAERKQARDLQRWYAELDESPRGGRKHGRGCPHCQRKGRQSAFGYVDEYMDEGEYYGEGMVYEGEYDGQFFTGEYVDGNQYGGSSTSGYCPNCQNQQFSPPEMTGPEYSSPPQHYAAPLVPPAEPTPAPAPPESGNPTTFMNQYYSPPSLPANQIRQVSIPPVEQILYAPSSQR